MSTLFHNYNRFDQHNDSLSLAIYRSSHSHIMPGNYRSLLPILAIVILLSACSSGPFKWNQSQRPAAVQENDNLPKVRQSTYTVLIVPSGAVKTSYISDKTSTAGGFLGSMVVGPIAGVIGSLAGSTAGGAAAASAEENASQNIDSSDIAQAVAPAQLPQSFAHQLSEKLAQCGIRSEVSPTLLSPDTADWPKKHLVLPVEVHREAETSRFIVEAGVTGLQVRAALKDTTLEGDAYARVYETRSLRQIGRYTYKTGSSGSVTLSDYGSKNQAKTAELQRSSQQVARYLAGGIAHDMCAIMARY